MTVRGLGWLGIRTPAFETMNTFYKDALQLQVLSIDEKSGRFKAGDGTEVHVYGPKDEGHEFFGTGPVVAFAVEDFAATRARLHSFGVEFIYQEPQRASGKIWRHFRAPDGNVYEIIGDAT